MKVVALAGGVGGAKLVNGLSKVIPGKDLSVIVNTGDDFLFHGLYVCPDLDTVLYTLAGINNPITGWGRNCETWHVLEELRKINEDVWFNIGDKDLSIHLERTRRLATGSTLTEVTRFLIEKFQVCCQVIPMTNTPVRTKVNTRELGRLDFQEYFVKHKFQPVLKSIEFENIENATLSPEVSNSINQADLVVICPSNPFVSIAPILKIPGILPLINNKTTVAVSPLIEGKAIRGPAAKMFKELGIEPGPMAVAEFYKDILNGLVYDEKDGDLTIELHRWGIISLAANTRMIDEECQVKLAEVVCQFGKLLMKDPQV